MTVRELIKKLEEMKDYCGDCEVVIYSKNTNVTPSSKISVTDGYETSSGWSHFDGYIGIQVDF